MKIRQIKAGRTVKHSITGEKWLVLARNYDEVILARIKDDIGNQKVLSWHDFEYYYDLVKQQKDKENV